MKWLNLRNLLLILFCLILSVIYISLKPFAETQIKKLIAQEVLKFEDIKNFDLSKVKIGLLPPNIEIENLDFLIKKSPEVKKISIEKVKIYPEILRLLSFDLRVKNIYVVGLNLNIKETKTQSKKIDIKFKYEDLINIPIKNIYIEDSKVAYNSTEIDIGYLDLRKKWNHYEFFSDLNKIRISKELPEVQINRLALEVRKNNIQLNKLVLISGDSYVQLGFEINKPFDEKLLELNFFDSTEVRLTSKLNLKSFKPLLEKHIKLNIKNLSGIAQLLLFKSGKSKKTELEFNLEAENLTFNNYFAEKLSTNGKVNKKQLKANVFKLINKNLELTSKNLILNKIENNISIKSEGQISKFEVGGFLTQNLNQKNIPIHVPGEVIYRCGGNLVPNLGLKCELEGKIQSLHVWGDSKQASATTIVKLPSQTFKAQASVYDTFMSFSSFNEFKNSQVAFTGEVDYIKGFNVSYSSDFFNFSDLISLANIPLEGFGNIKGTTRGSSRWGEFNLRADISNLAFFKYNLGQVVGDISYKKQNLYFDNLRSVIGDSMIEAEVDFNLKKSYLKAKAKSKSIEIQDILFAIKEIAVPPIYLSGEGNLDLEVEGPLNLGKMTYDIKGDFADGIIYKDRFKNLTLAIKAKEGEVVAQNQLVYLGDTLNIEGQVNPKGMVDIIAVGDSLNLSRINAIKDLGIEMSGLAQVQVQFKDYILNPSVTGKFKSANVIEEYDRLGGSEFNFVIHKNFSEIDGSLFNKAMVGEAHLPHNSEAPFLMNMELYKFDPFMFIRLFDSKISKVGSNTEISGKINVGAPVFKINKINGNFLLSEINLKAERSSLRLKSPSDLKIKNGVLNGRLTFLDQNLNQLKVLLSETKNSIKGKISLGFLRTLVPSVDEIQGLLEISSEFQVLPYFKFTSGKGLLNNLSLKIENLAHSFKDLSANLEFAQKNILITNLQGLFANGPISGAGKVYFTNGIGVLLTGRADRLNLNIPEDFRTTVSGDYEFKGEGFPYTLSGDFIVNDGLFKMEFGASSSEQFVVQPSPYLPSSKLSVSPLNLDLNIQTAKPIVIENSYIDGSATADLNLKGQPSAPIFKGQIRLTNDSKVIFQSNKFNVNSGLVTFNSVSPENGAINLDANARIKDFVDILEREYDIRMLVQGTGRNPQITFSSQPNLSEPQILSFLAFGMLENNSLNQEISLGDQQAQTGYQIGGIFLKNKFAKDIQDRLGVQFNFTSSYENQDVSPKVIVEKKFNSKFSLSGSRTLGAFQKNTVRGEYKINKKLSIIGLYENWDLDNQATLNRARLIDGDNVLGMDLQYNVEFK